MKPPRTNLFLVIAVTLVSGASAFAQTNGVPGPTDYAKFSQFVTDRNIFDPSRQPHDSSPNTRQTRRPRVRNSAPGITLVGTMSYEKGMFAFFNGNSADLKKALQVTEKIADYTVADITPSLVKLESTEKKEQLVLKVGDGLRQENGKWVFASGGELPPGTEMKDGNGNSSGGEDSGEVAAPSSTSEPNEVLKRLKQLREKENQ